jgi:hypothetical protein
MGHGKRFSGPRHTQKNLMLFPFSQTFTEFFDGPGLVASGLKLGMYLKF